MLSFHFLTTQCKKNNLDSLKELRKPIIFIKARHNKSSAVKVSAEEFGGLFPNLYLCIGARVMLTRNLWVSKGLCNGSMGYVVDVVYSEGFETPSLPVAVIVQFDGYTGPSFFEKERCVPIIPVTSAVDISGNILERQQIPLKLAWAITIHKAQGLTLNKAWVDIGKKECFDGLTYVALSRVRNLKDMIIQPFPFERIGNINKSKAFSFRKEEENRLHTLSVRLN